MWFKNEERIGDNMISKIEAIRQMSKWELAKLLDKISNDAYSQGKMNTPSNYPTNTADWYEWLQKKQ